jgi:hypothetical protein
VVLSVYYFSINSLISISFIALLPLVITPRIEKKLLRYTGPVIFLTWMLIITVVLSIFTLSIIPISILILTILYAIYIIFIYQRIVRIL